MSTFMIGEETKKNSVNLKKFFFTICVMVLYWAIVFAVMELFEEFKQKNKSPIYEMIKNNDPELMTVPMADLNLGKPSLIKGNELFFSDNLIIIEENESFTTFDEIIYKRLDRAFIEKTDSSWTKRNIVCNESNCEVVTSIR